MKKLSVIIPCYNTKEYIEPCVKSVVNNNIEDMEIILVNDGSTDDTLEELKRLKKIYKNIKIVDKENGGLSSARNAGIESSTGKYITFLDSDDTVEDVMYANMLNKALIEDYDMVTCGVKMIYNDHEQLVSPGINEDIKDKEKIKEIMPYFYPAACNKIYKRELFDNLKFKCGVYYEDVEFMYRLLPHLNNIGFINGYYYNYYQRENSITYTFNKKIYDFLDNMDSVVKYYKDNSLFDEYHAEIEYTYVRYAYATFVRRLSKMKNKKEFKKGVEEAIKRVNKQFPLYKKNKYLNKTKKGLYLKYFNKLISKIVYIIDKNKMN